MAITVMTMTGKKVVGAGNILKNSPASKKAGLFF
jgi:hypothetical protein